jgi:hypothetical protein
MPSPHRITSSKAGDDERYPCWHSLHHDHGPGSAEESDCRLASRDHTTFAGVIARSLDTAEGVAFWADVAKAIGTSKQVSNSLADGRDPEETWDDVW